MVKRRIIFLEWIKNTMQYIKSKENAVNICSIIILVIFYILIQNLLYENMCNSDWASENVIAKTLNETRTIISKEIYYNSEIRVLDEQLIQALLFTVGVSGWKANRICANSICFSLLLFAFVKILKELKIENACRYTIFVGALLICPISYAYADAFLCGGFYLWKTTIALSLLVCYNRARQKKEQGKVLWGLSLYAGICGIRLILVIIIPLIIGDFLENRKIGITAIGTLLSTGVGYGTNLLVTRQYGIVSYGISNFQGLDEKEIYIRVSEVIKKNLEMLGYNFKVNLFSTQGFLNVLVLLFFTVNILIIAYVWHFYRKSEQGFYIEVALLSVVFHAIAMIATGMLQARYFIFNFAILLPVYVLFIKARKEKQIIYFIISYFVLIGVIKTLSLMNTQYYNWQIQNAKREKSICFLAEQGYQFGYATYWNANIITEFTDGMIEVSAFWDANNREHFKWNSLKKYDDREYYEGKVFLLLTNNEVAQIEEAIKAPLVYEDEEFSIFEYENSKQYYEDFVESTK